MSTLFHLVALYSYMVFGGAGRPGSFFSEPEALALVHVQVVSVVKPAPPPRPVFTPPPPRKVTFRPTEAPPAPALAIPAAAAPQRASSPPRAPLVVNAPNAPGAALPAPPGVAPADVGPVGVGPVGPGSTTGTPVPGPPGTGTTPGPPGPGGTGDSPSVAPSLSKFASVADEVAAVTCHGCHEQKIVSDVPGDYIQTVARPLEMEKHFRNLRFTEFGGTPHLLRVAITVKADGKATAAVVESCGKPEVDAAAVAAVQDSIWQSARNSTNQPAAMTFEMHMHVYY
ncbi:MAG: hypothetical protein FJX76_26900 [Armatimonadetes bacterium]|nr:hypothetical protein [Armatimonadota bacterium]